jgi:hypothetical protein
VTRERRILLKFVVAALVAMAGLWWLGARLGIEAPDPAVLIVPFNDDRPLRLAFNAHPERTRVLVLLSPT